MLELLAVMVVIFSLGFFAGFGTRDLNSRRRRLHSQMHSSR
jgi:hypothetical protein